MENKNMEWTMDYIEDGDIVHVKMLNPIDLESTKQLCIETSSLARENQSHRYLIDHRGVDIVLTVLDIDKFPDVFREVGVDFNSKTAILLDHNEPKRNLFDFLKNVLLLTSMHFELYSDEDEAIAWLKSV
jgi:hypothetical protein